MAHFLSSISARLSQVCFALCVVTLASTAAADLAPRHYPDRLALVELLRHGDFKTLERRFSTYHSIYNRGAASDRFLAYAYDALRDSDPEIEKLLEKWIATHPESFVARTARGNYYRTIGWRLRGRAYINETPQVRIHGMTDAFEHATDDYAEAIRLEPRATSAYSGLIDIAKALGQRTMVDQIYLAGLEANPGSFLIPASYLRSLDPWWFTGNPHESFEAIGLIVEEIEARVNEFPWLQPLLAYENSLAADLSSRDRRFDDAHHFIDKALEISHDWIYLADKAHFYYRQNNFEKSLEYYNQAEALWPNCDCIITWRAKIFKRQKNYAASLQEYLRALAADPYDDRTLHNVGHLLRLMRRYDESRDYLDRAMVYGKFNPDLLWLRGRLLLSQFGNPEAALADFDAALALDPNHTGVWYWKGEALLALSDCKSAPTFHSYLDKCEVYKNCGDKWIARAHSRLNDVASLGCSSPN